MNPKNEIKTEIPTITIVNDLDPEGYQKDPLVEDVASAMFAVYGEHAGGVTWDGKPIPSWTDINDAVRSHWRAAAHHAIDRMTPPVLTVVGITVEDGGSLRLDTELGTVARISRDMAQELRKGNTVASVAVDPEGRTMLVLDTGALVPLEDIHTEAVTSARRSRIAQGEIEATPMDLDPVAIPAGKVTP